MSFDTLTPDLQNILLVNHSYMSKWLVFICIIFVSAFYIWGVWPNHLATPYFTQAFLRIFFYVLACVFLLASPIMIISMSPEYNFYDWYLLILKLYGVFTSITLVLLFIDGVSISIFYYLEKFGGLDMSNGRIKDIMSSWKNNKHFLKMKKVGK